MIDPQAYRIKIGMFSIRARIKLRRVTQFQDDANALGLALIITLLVIGGVEQNPGPDPSEQLPGPSFSGVTLMDVMEAIRITQFQIDGLTSRVNDLTKMIEDISQDGKQRLDHQQLDHSTPTSTPPSRPHPSPPATCRATDVEARPGSQFPVLATNSTSTPTSTPPSRTHPTPRATCRTIDVDVQPGTQFPESTTKSTSNPGVEDWATVVSLNKRKKSQACSPPPIGAVMLGCQNVRRIAMAARDEFVLGGQAVFHGIRGGTARCALGALHGAVASCRAIKADLVLHIGGNDLARHSVEYTLDCVAEVISAAKQINKVRDIIICSVPQDTTTSASYLSMKRNDLNDQIKRLCEDEGIRFLDLRSRLNECAFCGLDRSRLNMNRAGSRNAWQMLASEVDGFLD